MADRKNIVVFFTDQQRPDTLGFRNPLCKTPHIDRIFQNGISFDRCVTPSPLCGPARASVFTGRYAHQVKGVCPPHGTMAVSDSISESDDTMMTNDYTMDETPRLPRLLEAAGYQVSYTGKWHLGSAVIRDWFPDASGYSTKAYSAWCAEQGLEDGWSFNDFSVRSKRPPYMSVPTPSEMKLDPRYHGDAWITDQALDKIRRRDKTKPLFAVCALNGPHPPFKIPEPYLSLYADAAGRIPCPPNFRSRSGDPDYLKDCYYRLLAEDYSADWSDWQKSVAAYWGFVRLIDDQVGKIWDCLEQERMLESTLFVFLSDHGEMLGAHGLWQKMECYEESVRVPLLFSAPWIPHGVRSGATVSLLDFVPTVLEAAGVSYDPGAFEGVSLYGQVLGTSRGDPERVVFGEQRPLGVFHHAPDWRMAADSRYKYVWANGDRERFYDLARDPYELRNLAEEGNGAELARLRGALAAWARRTRDPLCEAIARDCGRSNEKNICSGGNDID